MSSVTIAVRNRTATDSPLVMTMTAPAMIRMTARTVASLGSMCIRSSCLKRSGATADRHAGDEVEPGSDADAERGATDDVERVVRPEVDAGRDVQHGEEVGDDLPAAGEVGGE